MATVQDFRAVAVDLLTIAKRWRLFNYCKAVYAVEPVDSIEGVDSGDFRICHQSQNKVV
jgi:hypothetical protein